MRRVLLCSGVLGGGAALVFALAALTATLFPHGTVVASSWNGMATMGSAPAGVELGPLRRGGVVVVANGGAGPVTVQVDRNGNPVLDADGNPLLDASGTLLPVVTEAQP